MDATTLRQCRDAGLIEQVCVDAEVLRRFREALTVALAGEEPALGVASTLAVHWYGSVEDLIATARVIVRASESPAQKPQSR